MNKILILFLSVFFVSCNGDSDGSSSEDTSITNVSGVENVNGNIPDTTNTISIDGSSQSTDTQIDTLAKDTLNKR